MPFIVNFDVTQCVFSTVLILPFCYVQIGVISSTLSSQSPPVCVLPSGPQTKFTSIEAAWCTVRNIFFPFYKKEGHYVLNTANCLKVIYRIYIIHILCVRYFLFVKKVQLLGIMLNIIDSYQQMHKP
jgi:hypothetical protein